ncbi:BT4734/BF3469 family protein [Sphingobacterium sp.]|uniref:BT4734/BF3469 family protein n=1 Tax=Sphingobacterium sp. TaxID=341027 RepID=UPI0028971197|nr:BT4734/BF3469 family protein [Sphingobacterium sp.]
MTNTYTFSFYPGPITKKIPKRDMSVKEAIELIGSDTYKDAIIKFRECENLPLKKTLKEGLPYFTFSGTFKNRRTESLIKHSGLLVLDFDKLDIDRLPELKEQIKTIEWVLAVWISPSGLGLKVLVKIDPHYHLDTFLWLKDFFAGNFLLDMDDSGKDIVRACFVSWDPEVYYNPASKELNAEELGINKVPFEMVQEKSVRLIAEEEIRVEEARLTFKIQRDLKRVEMVVADLEQENIDITDNYNNWQMIAFSLASLGEEARTFFHRVSALNGQYDYDEADKKFTDALKNRKKFKNANKFFSLAGKEGIDTKLPITDQEAIRQGVIKQTIGNADQSNDYIKYGIYLKKSEGVYYSLDLKGLPRPVSNFWLKILFHVNTSDAEAYRLIIIRNIFGDERVININTDDFVSAGSFKKVIARHGNYIWMGADADLVKLQNMLQREEAPTTMVKNLGFNRKGNFFAFANGIYVIGESKFLDIDPYGIVPTKNLKGEQINYFIPALSKIFIDKDDMYSNDKKFRLIVGNAKWSEWTELFCKVYGNNGRVGIAYFICALFSDIIFKAMGSRFPILFAYGKRGSGKGTMVQSLLNLYGEKQDQVMLGGSSTAVGFMRKLAQFINGLVWLDEYKNNLPVKTIESLKNIYDRIGYERGKKDNTFQTESTPISSACILSGQEMPTIEPALFSRNMLISFSETVRTEEARQLYRSLVSMEKEGLSHLTVGLLAYRNLVADNFKEFYEEEIRNFSKLVAKDDIDERMLSNWSMMITIIGLLSDHISFPFTVDEFRDQCKELLLSQFSVLQGSDDTSKFWQIVEQLFTDGSIIEDKHFKLENGNIHLRVQDIYQMYAEAMHRRRDPNVLDRATLENYLRSDASFEGRKKAQFGGKYTWGMVFKYSGLNVDLIRGADVEDLRKKLQAMGLKMDDEPVKTIQIPKQMDAFNDGFPEPDGKEVTL